ncbi:MAG: hypothetical protein WAQ25_02920 [Candidatus Saccharimonas sp.]
MNTYRLKLLLARDAYTHLAESATNGNWWQRTVAARWYTWRAGDFARQLDDLNEIIG